ncbi:hypothetical protein HQ346_24985 [Rhodococcus sp. BP-252]|uniref:Uncharacterized protein n=1 Tax=Rhodococcoides kyotonense TaxID=398843 RepID=A0A177YHR1_9NOCA|nr:MULTISPECIES: hypothetical protein [Rhodococcus]MBY6414837.1 hypothetical protein [Rhodococcus sp. BP-320]MBY6419756.1 hypothetical protein [Rhodococcus sp. BP-321]MBY6423149.1 hypothetical protein [Rhodococcus sp. BP-324]MBY6429715.1 hypothetical protein [Rhodococcus sp. BP-323]MBY6434687.1 hypothetical protein [Rhodococcus sp. BP-322]
MNEQPTPAKRLSPFRPWQVLNRYLYTLERPSSAGVPILYTVEVDSLSEDDTVQLYENGYLATTNDLPASIEIDGGTIEVAVSLYGVTRVDFVSDDGTGRRLAPVPGTLEYRRRRFDRRHPRLSRAIGWAAIAILVVNLVLAASFALEIATKVPMVAEQFGTFVSPIQLPAWANTTLVVAGILAATERVLTLRHNKILDLETIWAAS